MTATDHTRYTEWDAAYVLGALSPAERRDFEAHLEECDRCRAAVAELGALPGLLGRLDATRAFAVLDGDADAGLPDPDDLVARIRQRDRGERLRRRLLSIGGLAAAAVLASVLTLVVPAIVAPPQQPTETVAFVPADDAVPVQATAELSRVGWGTSIRMTCSYHAIAGTGAGGGGGGDYAPVQYALWVTGTDGTESALSTWSSTSGDSVVVTAGTAIALDQISHLEVRDASGVRVLLEAQLDH
jgi:hypothetical protein